MRRTPRALALLALLEGMDMAAVGRARMAMATMMMTHQRWLCRRLPSRRQSPAPCLPPPLSPALPQARPRWPSLPPSSTGRASGAGSLSAGALAGVAVA